MPTMKAAQILQPGADFEIVEREIPEPGSGQVRIKVEACGVCHTDASIKAGYSHHFPRIPGHEVAGRVDQVGDGVTAWQAGQRVGVGWHGGHCLQCDRCRAGDFKNCRQAQNPGVAYDGGYAEYMVAPQEALVQIPDSLSAVEAAPLLCAGITTFNALRNSGAKAGEVVAVQGIGGLGHLGVQFAHKLGFKTVAISRGADKAELARQLGADIYLDTNTANVTEELTKLGGASVILATAPSGKAIASLIDGLGISGKLLMVAAVMEPIEVSGLQLFVGGRSIQGWLAGTPKDSEDTLSFSVLSGVRAMIETFPLEKVNEAFDRMMNNQARFRVVLEMNQEDV